MTVIDNQQLAINADINYCNEKIPVSTVQIHQSDNSRHILRIVRGVIWWIFYCLIAIQ